MTMKTFKPSPDLPPPPNTIGLVGWLRSNLFSSWYNVLFTLVSSYLIFLFGAFILDWAILSADWTGRTSDACSREGACWPFVSVRIDQFVYGFYTPEEIWRVNWVFFLSGATVIALML